MKGKINIYCKPISPDESDLDNIYEDSRMEDNEQEESKNEFFGRSFLYEPEYQLVGSTDFIDKHHYKQLKNSPGKLMDTKLGCFDFTPKERGSICNQSSRKASILEE